jgi:hypothetical protein
MNEGIGQMEDIKELFRNMGRELGQAIGESMIETVRGELPRLRDEFSSAGGPPFTRRLSTTRGARVSAALSRPCPVDGCTNPGRGPRFSFLCEVHRDLPESEREKYRVRPRR